MLISPPVTVIPVIAPIPVAVTAPAKSNPTRHPGERQQERNHDKGETSATARSSEQTQQAETDEQSRIEELKQRDQEVRTHEAAHQGAAGQYAQGGAQYTYERGPDGHQYAVAGEVRIDTSTPDDAHEALQKSAVLMRAALAPAQPSTQDKQVAAEASQMGIEARHQIMTERANETESGSVPKPTEALNAAYEIPQQSPAPLIDVLV